MIERVDASDISAGGANLAELVGLEAAQRLSVAQLAHDLYEQGRNEDARTLFAGLIALDPGDFYGQAGLGQVLLDMDLVEESIPPLEVAVRLRPAEPGAHACLGEAYLRTARFEEAAQELRIAIELDPEQNHPGAGRARAIIGGVDELIDEVTSEESDSEA